MGRVFLPEKNPNLQPHGRLRHDASTTSGERLGLSQNMLINT